MKVYVITLEMDYEGGVVEEVWKDESQAKHRVRYLNKNKAGVMEKYHMKEYDVKTKRDVNCVTNEVKV